MQVSYRGFQSIQPVFKVTQCSRTPNAAAYVLHICSHAAKSCLADYSPVFAEHVHCGVISGLRVCHMMWAVCMTCAESFLVMLLHLYPYVPTLDVAQVRRGPLRSLLRWVLRDQPDLGGLQSDCSLPPILATVLLTIFVVVFAMCVTWESAVAAHAARLG